jgi:hypothetical protein
VVCAVFAAEVHALEDKAGWRERYSVEYTATCKAIKVNRVHYGLTKIVYLKT